MTEISFDALHRAVGEESAGAIWRPSESDEKAEQRLPLGHATAASSIRHLRALSYRYHHLQRVIDNQPVSAPVMVGWLGASSEQHARSVTTLCGIHTGAVPQTSLCVKATAANQSAVCTHMPSTSVAEASRHAR